jgi:Protein of unknown function (DUF2628)
MRIYTAHTRAGSPPVLVREGFSWGAFFFGPLWLLAHRAWIAGVLALCVWIGLGILVPHGAAAAVALALHWALGLFGRDLWRWSLARAGYLLVHVIAARDEDSALARLLERRPDLIGDALGAEVLA